ncbi:MAG: NrfD/PsrC family molybdoenzyme membrane anchor subunit [bacterium]|nr:NrfD/PsrC family molybdoenzyme membrane anchor subunit [bacterium]
MEREIVANAFHHAYWGVPIAAYYWMAGISEGIFLFASLGWGFGIKQFKPVSFFLSVVSFLLISVVQVLLVFDLGKVEKAVNMFPLITGYWHETSPLAWGVILVAFYSVGILLYAIAVYAEKDKLARIFGPITFVLAGGLCWYTGVTMELNPSRHPNHSSMAPLLFFVGANLSGIGGVIVIIWIRDLFLKSVTNIDRERITIMGQVLLIGIVFDLFLIFSEMMQMTYGTEEEYHTLQIVKSVFSGPLLMYYMGMGLVLPLIILVSPLGKKRGGLVLSAALVVAGMFGMRLGWVLVAQFSQSFF